MSHRSTALLAASLLPAALLAMPAAGAAEREALSAATDSKARVPETPYPPPFSGYQPFREQKLGPWRDLNQAVHQAGGHSGIFGGARAPTPHPPEHKK